MEGKQAIPTRYAPPARPTARQARPWRASLAASVLAGLAAAAVAMPAPQVYGQTATATATATATPVQRPGGRFEENDPALLYFGTWTAVTDGRASGGALRRAGAAGAYAQFTFPGPNVRWITTKGPDRGIAHVVVDDQDRGTVDLYAASEAFQQEFSWGGLAGDTNHTIRVEVTGQRSGASNGANVDVDAFVAAGAVAPEPLRFEDVDPAVVYSGAWTTTNEPRASGNSAHRSTDPNAAAQFSFSGASISWLTSTGPTRGRARVLVDGKLRDTVDLYSADERFQQSFRYENLGEGSHTIRVETTGTHSGPSTDNVVDVDAFVVFGAPTTPVPTPTLAGTATATPSATPTAMPTATPLPAPQPAPVVPHDARYFFETGYRVDYDPFWGYFNVRGGVDVFGFPISRSFLFLGCTTQVFQRQLLQQCGAGQAVRTMNLLDPDLMPYNQINFSTFPAHDPVVAGAAPPPGTPNYGAAVLDYVRRVAPDTFEGLPVNFLATFQSTVAQDATGDPNVTALINLEIWGFPTSRPQYDPSNRNFVYQRFQRGIMHFDATTRVTRGILLADYFKSLLAGQNLPTDLAAQAQNSRYLRQYLPGAPLWLSRPQDLPVSDLTFAFEQD